MKIKGIYIVVISSLLTFAMVFVDAIIQPPYFQKSIIKIVLFLLIPIIYLVISKQELNVIKRMFKFEKKSFIKSLLLGIGVYVAIIVAYFIFKDLIDLNNIEETLSTTMKVNADNFIFVALYISFINSLLEEFFFRGYVFMLVKQYTKVINSYLYSGIIFALYHVGMLQGWFDIYIYLLAMVSLFVGGCIFNYLNDKWKSIYPSWLVHLFANLAINTIGLILFGII